MTACVPIGYYEEQISVSGFEFLFGDWEPLIVRVVITRKEQWGKGIESVKSNNKRDKRPGKEEDTMATTTKKSHPNALFIVQRFALFAVAVLAVGSIFLATVQAQVPNLPPAGPVSETTATPSATPTETVTPTFTPTVTRTPAPTLIPCPPVGQPTSFGEIQVVFHEAVPSKACHYVLLYAELTSDEFAEMGIATGPVEIAVFATVDAITEYVYETARLAGCNPDDKEIIRSQWIRGGAMVTKGAVFLREGKVEASFDIASHIAGEVTQATMINILGSCQLKWQVPDWYAHGLSEYHMEVFTNEWGLKPWEEDLYKCRYRLEQLKPGEECIYMEAQMAFHLLRELSGADRGMDVIIQMSKGKSFNTAFYDVYGLSVSDFSNAFDEYRAHGYRLAPTSTPSTPPSGDGG